MVLAIAYWKEMLAWANFTHVVDSTLPWELQHMIADVSGQGLANDTLYHDHSIIDFCLCAALVCSCKLSNVRNPTCCIDN